MDGLAPEQRPGERKSDLIARLVVQRNVAHREATALRFENELLRQEVAHLRWERDRLLRQVHQLRSQSR